MPPIVASLRTEHTREQVRIYRNVEGIVARSTGSANFAAGEGKPESIEATAASALPVLVQHAAAGKRPYIHPILAPDGVGELTENEPGHHLWQHGLYVGLNDVNGVGFWTEGLHEKNTAIDGTFHPQPMLPPTVRPWADHTRAAWEVVSEWRASPTYAGFGGPGAPMLNESQTWCLQDHHTYWLLDLTWKLEALQDLTFGQYAYGGLFLRMPFREGAKAESIDSEGRVNGAAEAQRAKWVSVAMPIPGRAKKKVKTCGIALLDHPSNPGHPSPWRVDNQLGIAPSRSIPGPWPLKQGFTTTSRYRLYIFSGPTDPAAVAAQWSTFAKEEQ